MGGCDDKRGKGQCVGSTCGRPHGIPLRRVEGPITVGVAVEYSIGGLFGKGTGGLHGRGDGKGKA
jgi:hypothetical protein